MKPANDNEVLSNETPACQVDAGTVDASKNTAGHATHDDADVFLQQNFEDLSPIFLQGDLVNLSEDIQRLVKRFNLTQESVEELSDKLCTIIETSGSAAQSQSDCITTLMPIFGNNPNFAEKWYAWHVLQCLTSERIAILAADKIEGFEPYATHGLFSDDALKQRQTDMDGNGRSLQHLLTEFGVGGVQAQQFLRRFDSATQSAIDAFKGISHQQG